jgi:hypothetical protein
MIYGVHREEHLKSSKVKIPKKTEYQLQFVRHPIITTPEAKRNEEMVGGAARNLIGI